MPFHAALNHDGLLTGQWGIHSRFETETFERYREQLDVRAKAAVRGGKPRDLGVRLARREFLVQSSRFSTLTPRP